MITLIANGAASSASQPTDWLQLGVTFVVGAVGGWISGTLKVRGQQRVFIDSLVQKIIESSMQYPYLERDSYCSAWQKGMHENDEDSRYENYCCLVFNLIEKAWDQTWPWFFNGLRHKAVKKILHVEELICRHHEWWSCDQENLDGYSKGFRAYMSYVIDECKRGKKL
jgi:hypothetical protein